MEYFVVIWMTPGIEQPYKPAWRFPQIGVPLTSILDWDCPWNKPSLWRGINHFRKPPYHLVHVLYHLRSTGYNLHFIIPGFFEDSISPPGPVDPCCIRGARASSPANHFDWQRRKQWNSLRAESVGMTRNQWVMEKPNWNGKTVGFSLGILETQLNGKMKLVPKHQSD